MATLRPLPDPGLPWSNPATGRPTEPFAAYMQSLNGINLRSREVLTADRAISVPDDYATIQAAVDAVAALDLSIYAVDINVTAGTWAEAVVLKSYTGVGPVTIIGDIATPSNVIINAPGDCFNANAVRGKWRIGGFKLQTSVSGFNGVLSANGSFVECYEQMNYGAMTGGFHLVSGGSALLRALKDYTISGSAIGHIMAVNGATSSVPSLLNVPLVTVTLTGTPTFDRYAYADRNASLEIPGIAFVGTFIGRRYFVSANAVIYTQGAGENYLPGTIDGIRLSGGQYN